MNKLSKPLSDDDMIELDDWLLNCGGVDEDEVDEEDVDGILSISELDGFLTAIISSPKAIMPNQWIPSILGDRAISSEEEASHFFGLIMRLYNSILTNLSQDPSDLPIIIDTSHVEDSDREILVAEDWCCGYLKGVVLANWSALPPEQQAQLDKITLHGTEAGWDKLENMSLEQHQASVHEVAPAAGALYQYWLPFREMPSDLFEPKQRIASKTGRNEACPCGSGKKYKHCCLNRTLH